MSRLKIVVKWGTLLLLVALLISTGSSFIAAVVSRTSATSDPQTVRLIGSIAGMVLTLPFVWVFVYKATTEYLQNNKWIKNIGMVMGLTIVFYVAVVSGVIGYFTTGHFNVGDVGLLPLLLGFVAGSNAEKKFASSK